MDHTRWANTCDQVSRTMVRTGPDDLDAAAVGAGGSEPPLVGPGTSDVSGRSVTRVTTRSAGWLFHNVALGRRSCPRPALVGACEGPAAREALEQLALDGVRRGAGHVDDQR
jgi:hypothetical protein